MIAVEKGLVDDAVGCHGKMGGAGGQGCREISSIFGGRFGEETMSAHAGGDGTEEYASSLHLLEILCSSKSLGHKEQ